MKEKAKHSHAGHRDRMRARFLSTKGNGMLDHELLELLLYHAIPRCDTNDLAHRLIEEFGSLTGVLEANEIELCRVNGIGERAAVFLMSLGEASRRYARSKLAPHKDDSALDTPEKIATYLWPRFLGSSVEKCYVLLFDNSMHLLDCFETGEGVVSGVTVSMRRITEQAYRKNAAAVIVAHNHPKGLAVPSGNDISLTRQIDEALRLLEVPLLEHFVFSERAYTPIMSPCRTERPEEYAASSLLDLYRKRASECRAIHYHPTWLGQYTKEELDS